MTLKELRVMYSLTQKDCAEFLGISERTYQKYENDSALVNSSKYNAYCKKLESYSANLQGVSLPNQIGEFNTKVVTGSQLTELTKSVAKFEKRDCFQLLKKFIDEEYVGKICILYGLRRTGKTTLLFQMISTLPVDKTAYIKAQSTDSMSALTKDLDRLQKRGYKYIFIDEITLLSDFINTAAVLSDVFGMSGMKIIASGADSLVFAMANRDELYDRNVMIHTSFIPFREYSRLLKINSIDKYIEYGGTLKKENMGFDDPDVLYEEVSFRDDESTRKYIDTAISRNIQHTLKNDHYGEYFNQLRELYENGELTNVINRIVENMNHKFLLSVVEQKFKSHDFGSAKDLLLHDVPEERAYALGNVDYGKILSRLKDIISVKEKEELKIKVTEEHIKKVKKYLIMLDLMVNCPDRFESGKRQDHYIFTQPGMRYSIAKALIYSLMQDEYFNTLSEFDKNYIVNKILDDVKGRMLEDIVILETSKCCSKNKQAFKFLFDEGGEFDMVTYDSDKNCCSIYEIKHSDKIADRQARYLTNEERCNLLESKFGKIVGKYVLYRGEDTKVGEVQYLNVEKYLIGLK